MKNNGNIRSNIVKESLVDYNNLVNTLKENTDSIVKDILRETVLEEYTKLLNEGDEEYDVEEVNDTDSVNANEDESAAEGEDEATDGDDEGMESDATDAEDDSVVFEVVFEGSDDVYTVIIKLGKKLLKDKIINQNTQNAYEKTVFDYRPSSYRNFKC